MPKIIFCDVENYKVAVKVVADLNLNCRIVLMNGELEGVSSILSLVEPKLRYECEPFA